MDDWTPDLKDDTDSPIVERFDPSWKHNYLWAFDPASSKFDMWETKGTHHRQRQDLEERWGNVPSGIVLGAGSYIPEERHIDGRIVAPPVMLLQAYYAKPIPQEAYDWVEDKFPGTVARAARLSAGQDFAEFKPDMTQASNKIIRWIWNRKDGTLVWQASAKGLPTHDQKVLAEWGREVTPNDKRGYAIPEGDKLEIESFDTAVPPLAYQTVKQQLIKLYPQYQVQLPNETAGDHGVTFGDNVGILARHQAAGSFVYAQVRPLQMPPEAPVSDSQPPQDERLTRGRALSFLSRLKPRKKKSGADKDGAMIALFIPADVGEKLKQKGGEPVEDMHITLVFFAEKAADRDDWDKVEEIVQTIAAGHDALSGKINGMGVFSNDEDVLWAAPSVPGLAELRDDVVEAVEDAGFTVSSDHGWTPHITLKYGFTGKLPKIDSIPLSLDSITFARGDNQKVFELDGGFQKETSESADAEQWSGAHHFVTDGTKVHLVAEPRHEDGHEDEFRSMHGTEPDDDTTEGWTIPTKDEMGFGIYAPDAGLKNDNEPALHEVQNSLEKELGKPGHFIEDWDGFTAA